ncbi:unnamed protein product [Ceratitis capitata]|uniref:(Mediterranean fruit fly) hypothetical protein n=1 Tax=Ceratitis capitata TaxID=7213 RepID=A0A811UPX2_CERCA|nr:unnamed protein product [Ceratitis capitata]
MPAHWLASSFRGQPEQVAPLQNFMVRYAHAYVPKEARSLFTRKSSSHSKRLKIRCCRYKRSYDGLRVEYRLYIFQSDFRAVDELLNLNKNFELLKNNENRSMATTFLVTVSSQVTPAVNAITHRSYFAQDAVKTERCRAAVSVSTDKLNVQQNYHLSDRTVQSLMRQMDFSICQS